MKLEVGMHCYNKTNRKLGIGKIISFQRNNNANIKYKNDIELVSIGNIEASHNIIELVEQGDYVNGNKVIRIETSSYPEDKNVKIIVCCGNDDYYFYYNEDIKSILTKEAFKANEYRMETD